MRPRRRNSDEAFRRLLRQVANDPSLIPALARAWERQGRSPLSDDVLRDVVGAFASMERSADLLDGPADVLLLLTNMDDYPECDVYAVVNADAGYIKGVSDATGLTYEELWTESERVRGGAGTARRDRLELGHDQDDQDDPEARRLAARGSATGWAHTSMAPECPAACPRCGNAGNLHHEGGAHYCAECDDIVAGERLLGCPGIEGEDET